MCRFSSFVQAGVVCSFYFHPTATTEIYTLSLHDALPISDFQHVTSFPISPEWRLSFTTGVDGLSVVMVLLAAIVTLRRSEEHTSELQSPDHLVCRLLLGKKK